MSKLEKILEKAGSFVVEGLCIIIGLTGCINSEQKEAPSAEYVAPLVPLVKRIEEPDSFNLDAILKKITKANKDIENKPAYIHAYFERSCAKADLGDYHASLNDVNYVLKEIPRFYAGLIQRSYVKFRLNMILSAIEDLNFAIEVDSNSDSAYYLRGLFQFVLTNYESAAKDFTKTLELNPTKETAEAAKQYLDTCKNCLNANKK